MKRAAALILVVLTVCLSAVADTPSATDPTAQARDLVRFGKQDLAHGLATTALAYFDEALHAQPNSADAWAGKARALEMLKRYDEARTASQKALQLAPDNPAAWATEGKILLDKKQYNEALNALNKSLTLHDDMAVWQWKGQALDSLGRHDEALNAYTKASPPAEHYRGGITRMTSGGPPEEKPAKGKGKEKEMAPNTTGDESPEEEEPTPPQPQGFVWPPISPYDYGYDEQPPTPPVAENEDEYFLPGSFYDGGLVGDFHNHHRNRTYGGYYNNGYEGGGTLTSVAPRTIAPYRGVEPLYQQSVVPQYFEPVTPSYQDRVEPDYRGAAGNPIIGDRWNFPQGSGLFPEFDSRPYNSHNGYGHRGRRSGRR